MPIDQCPGCGNDLYAPYTYCNACEWEAKGKKKQARERKAKEQKEKQKKRKGRERKENVKHRERDEEWEPIPSKKQSRGKRKRRPPRDDYEEWDEPAPPKRRSRKKHREPPSKDESIDWEEEEYEPEPPRRPPRRPKPVEVPCKCGGTIIVKTSKRPIKIKCEDCGRTGTLKTPPPEEEPEPSEYDSDLRRSRTRASHDYEDQLWGPREEEVKNCNSCGTRLSDDDYCPRCMTRREPYSRTFVSYNEPYPGSYYDQQSSSYSQPPSQGRHDYPDEYEEEDRRDRGGLFGHKKESGRRKEVKKPRKGKCQECGSKSLQFYDDGTGRCPNCGRTFQWHDPSGGKRKRPSRDDEMRGRGGRGRRRAEREPEPRPQPPQYTEPEGGDEFYCPECGLPMRYISEYQRYYCDYCKEYE